MCLLRNIRGLVRGAGGLTRLGRFVLLCGLSIPVVAQSPQFQTVQGEAVVLRMLEDQAGPLAGSRRIDTCPAPSADG
jgi:hypothetical protein